MTILASASASPNQSRSKAWDIAPGKDFPNMLIRFRNLASAPATAFLIVFRFQRSNPETTAFPGAFCYMEDRRLIHSELNVAPQ